MITKDEILEICNIIKTSHDELKEDMQKEFIAFRELLETHYTCPQHKAHDGRILRLERALLVGFAIISITTNIKGVSILEALI